MERETFENWLDSYGRAWMGRDPNAAAALYTDDATYQVTPFGEALRGRDEIRTYWEWVARTEERIQFHYEVIAVTAENGVARWWASFLIVPPGLETKLDGIFVISLNAEGRCLSLREWWHKLQ
jgi:uncharacterized protein (TIGR02246 family)